MRYFLKFAALPIALVVVMMFAVSAQADVQVSQEQFSESPFQTSVTNVSVATSNGTGKLLVLFDEHFQAETHSSKCHWVKEAYNSGENADGTLFWFKDTHMRVCPSKTSPTGWAKVAGGMTGRNCGNAVRLSKPPRNVVPRSHVKLLAHLVITANIRVTAVANLSGSATATCSVSGASATSSVNASGSATASAEASATASTKTKAIAQGTTKAMEIVTKSKAALYTAAKTEASTTISGKATALCKGVTPPPHEEPKTEPKCPEGMHGTPPYCETPEEPKCHEGETGTPPHCETPKKPEQPKVTIERIQELETNEEGMICAKVDPPVGDVVNVQFEAEFGSFIDGGKGNLKTGTDRYCNSTYKAPSEEPPHTCVEPIAEGLPPGTKCDIISVFVQSSNGSKPVEVKKEAPIIAETPF